MRRDFMDWRFNIGPFEGVVIVIALLAVAFVIWMLIDAIVRPTDRYSSPGAKTGWIVGLILGLLFGFGFLGFVVAIAYLFVVKIPAGRHPAAPAWNVPPPVAGGPPPPGPAMPPPTPVYCSNCGTKIVAGARFCHSCGTPIA